MATGRMINKKICLNKAVNDLSCDTSRLAFTWTIPHLDRDGRIHGDPAVLKSIVFPRRQDISVEQMEEYIKEWVAAGLVIWYEAEGDLWIQFPKFAENQKGMRYDKEPSSDIPGPEEGSIIEVHITEILRTNDGQLTEKVRKKNVKSTEEVRTIDGKSTEKGRKDDGRMTENVRPNRKEKKRKEKNILLAANESPPQTNPPLNPEKLKEQSLFVRIQSAFESKYGQFENYGKEGKAIKNIIKKARARSPDNPEPLIHLMIEQFWQLKQHGNGFWHKQPFLPSVLNSSGIWPRVLEEINTQEIPESDPEFEEELKEIFG